MSSSNEDHNLNVSSPAVPTSGADRIDQEDEALDRERRIGWGRIFLYTIGGIVAAVLLLMLVDAVVMPWYVKLGQVESVPDVVGLPYAEARKRLEKLGFEVKKGEPRFDSRYPTGAVVLQSPYGGAQTKKGRRVYLTLSRGTELIPVPDLLGMQIRDARINLMRSGLELGEVIYDHNDTIMKGLVFAQNIPPKIGARPGTVVDVMVSRGPSTRFTMMPNLLSLDIDQARSRLENAGLVLGVVRFKDDPAYVKNTVIEQGVTPYSQVAQGAAIDLTICGVAEDGEGLSTDEAAPDEETTPPARR